MLIGPGAVISTIPKVLAFNVLLKMAVVGVTAHIAAYALIDPRPHIDRRLKSTALITICGTLAFQLPMWLFNGLIGVLLGLMGFWLVVTFTLDHFFDIDYDKSYALTGRIVGTSVLVWLIIGAVILSYDALG